MKMQSMKVNETYFNIGNWSICLLPFAFVVMFFTVYGAFGSEMGYSITALLGFSDAVMLLFLGIYWRPWRPCPPLVSLVLMWTIWVAITCVLLVPYGDTVVIRSLIEVLYCPLLFFCIYTSAKTAPSTVKRMSMGFTLLLLVVSLLFVLISRYKYAESSSFRQTNDVYYPLLLLPWVLLCRKQIVKNMGVLLIIGIVLWSLKRTAFVALVLSLVVYYMVEGKRLGKSINRKMIAGVGVIVVMSVSMYVVFDEVNDGAFSQRFIEAGDDAGSGRPLIYTAVLQSQVQSTSDQWMFGHGHNGVSLTGVYPVLRAGGYKNYSAHNDWLEVLYDYGLPGFVIYVAMHLMLLRIIYRLVKQRSSLGAPVAASYMLFFLLSLSSHLVLYASYYSYLMSFWAITCVMQEQERSVSYGSVYERGGRLV